MVTSAETNERLSSLRGALRGRSGGVALQGATMVCLEASILGPAAASSCTVASLERLNGLREAIRRNGCLRLPATDPDGGP